VIILTYFGTTTGLELLHRPLANSIPLLVLEDAWIEVTPSQLTLHPDKDAVVIFRRHVSGQIATWIGIYRHAYEMGYDRRGSFYGAGAWIVSGVVDARLLIQLLREMAAQIKTRAMSGDRLTKRISEAANDLTIPASAAALLEGSGRLSSGCKPEGEAIFIVENNSSTDVIEWAQRASSAACFSKIVIGSADQAPTDVRSSTFRLFSSLPLAMEASYQRLASDTKIRLQEIEILGNEKINKDAELERLELKLRQSEDKSRQWEASANEYRRRYIAAANSAYPVGGSVANQQVIYTNTPPEASWPGGHQSTNNEPEDQQPPRSQMPISATTSSAQKRASQQTRNQNNLQSSWSEFWRDFLKAFFYGFVILIVLLTVYFAGKWIAGKLENNQFRSLKSTESNYRAKSNSTFNDRNPIDPPGAATQNSSDIPRADVSIESSEKQKSSDRRSQPPGKSDTNEQSSTDRMNAAKERAGDGKRPKDSTEDKKK